MNNEMHAQLNEALINQVGLQDALYNIEREALQRVLKAENTHAGMARLLGLQRSTLIMKLKAHGLFVPKPYRAAAIRPTTGGSE